MPKPYTKHCYYRCKIVGEACGSDVQYETPPDCKNCQDYVLWKKSDLTIKEFKNKRL